MVDIIKAVLRSLGVDLEDVRIGRVHEFLGNDLLVPTNEYSISLVNEGVAITIELTKLGTKEACMTLYECDDDNAYPVKFSETDLADITVEELREILSGCIK